MNAIVFASFLLFNPIIAVVSIAAVESMSKRTFNSTSSLTNKRDAHKDIKKGNSLLGTSKN